MKISLFLCVFAAVSVSAFAADNDQRCSDQSNRAVEQVTQSLSAIEELAQTSGCPTALPPDECSTPQALACGCRITKGRNGGVICLCDIND